MRRHENIGYDAFNTYRSGDESSRRSDYGSNESNARGGRSVYGRSSRDTDASDHNFSTEPGFYGSGYSSRSQSQQPSNQNSGSYESNRYSQIRPQNQGGSWSQQSSREQYGNRDSYNSPSNMYRGENRSWQDRTENWADRAGNRMENWADRAEDRIERWGDKINNAWDRWSGDEDNRVRQNWMNHPEHYPTYSHGNANANRYSENYDNSSYGNRYENRGEYRRNRDEDEGFFGHIGNRISNAWDRWVGDDSDEERRYQQRSRYGNSGNQSSGNRPGQYGSPRRDDYEW
ncbi:hypothetical protein [Adhaeribacter terreus]|uniref:SWFGD domain-containing protein n=1 Tax=Adhaeribacter terreus TaxID=529703 RepID=A0ABW0E9S7_9BACT